MLFEQNKQEYEEPFGKNIWLVMMMAGQLSATGGNGWVVQHNLGQVAGILAPSHYHHCNVYCVS